MGGLCCSGRVRPIRPIDKFSGELPNFGNNQSTTRSISSSKSNTSSVLNSCLATAGNSGCATPVVKKCDQYQFIDVQGVHQTVINIQDSRTLRMRVIVGDLLSLEKSWADNSAADMEEIDMNEFDLLGKTALMYAVEHGRAKIVEFLINHGSKVNVASPQLGNQTPLMMACMRGHVGIAQQLIEADPMCVFRFSTLPDKWTCLQFSVSSGRYELIELVLAAIHSDRRPADFESVVQWVPCLLDADMRGDSEEEHEPRPEMVVHCTAVSLLLSNGMCMEPTDKPVDFTKILNSPVFRMSVGDGYHRYCDQVLRVQADLRLMGSEPTTRLTPRRSSVVDVLTSRKNSVCDFQGLDDDSLPDIRSILSRRNSLYVMDVVPVVPMVTQLGTVVLMAPAAVDIWEIILGYLLPEVIACQQNLHVLPSSELGEAKAEVVGEDDEMDSISSSIIEIAETEESNDGTSNSLEAVTAEQHAVVRVHSLNGPCKPSNARLSSGGARAFSRRLRKSFSDSARRSTPHDAKQMGSIIRDLQPGSTKKASKEWRRDAVLAKDSPGVRFNTVVETIPPYNMTLSSSIASLEGERSLLEVLNRQQLTEVIVPAS